MDVVGLKIDDCGVEVVGVVALELLTVVIFA